MCKCVSYRYLIPVTEKQPEGNADALYAFTSRGCSGEIGLDAANVCPATHASFASPNKVHQMNWLYVDNSRQETPFPAYDHSCKVS